MEFPTGDDDFGSETAITDIDLHRSIPERVETTTSVELIVNRLIRESGSWSGEGFEAGQVVYIEGIAGDLAAIELYDLETDQEENLNIANDVRNEPLRKSMAIQMKENWPKGNPEANAR